MKTYSEFILEAEPIKWNAARLKGSGMSPADTAGQRLTSLSRQMTARGTTPTQMVNIAGRIKRMKAGITNADEKFRTKDPRPETRATTAQRTGRMRVNTGRATIPRGETPISSVGTVAGHDRRIVNMKTNDVISNTSLAPGMTVSGSQINDPNRRNRPTRSGGTYGVKG